MAAVIQRMNNENVKAGRPRWMDPKLKREIVPHGFRSSFRDWASETSSFPHEVVEKALAHAIKSRVERAYRRDDLLPKRAKLMQAWALYCERTPTATADNVTPIRAVAL